MRGSMAVLIAPVVLLGSVPCAAQVFKAGVAVVDITPPIGYRMSGYFRERLSTAVHDPLHARALVLEQGAERGAIVICELIGVPVEATGPARERAAERTDIPAGNILVAATHTHTGPEYFGVRFAYFKEQAVVEHGTDPHEETSYLEMLQGKLVQAIVEASAHCVPVEVRAGTATQDGLAFNRRFHMQDGSVRFNPGKQNPDIVRPAGPTDPQVPLLLFQPQRGARPSLLLWAFALHLDTVGGTEYAVDYPYYVEQALHERHPNLVSMFAIGTAGDINHIDVSTKTPQKGHEEARRIGKTLGGTVSKALPGLAVVESPAFAVRSVRVPVPLQHYSDDEVALALAHRAQITDGGVPFLERVRIYKIVDLQSRGGTSIEAEVQVFRIGREAAIVGLPGEVFVDLGLAIKQASPFKTTLIVTLANDYAGYIPTRKAFEEGSYETVNSRVQSGGGEQLVETAIRLLKELAE